MSDINSTVSDAVCEAVRELVLAKTDDPSAFLVTDDEIRQIVAEESAIQRAGLLDAARVRVRASLAEREAELPVAMAAPVAKVSALDFTPSGLSDVEEAQRLLAETIAERRANPMMPLEGQLLDWETLITVASPPVTLGTVMEELGLVFADGVSETLRLSACPRFRAAGWLACITRVFSDDELAKGPARTMGYRRPTWFETVLILRHVGLDRDRFGAPNVISGLSEGLCLCARVTLNPKEVTFRNDKAWTAENCCFLFVRDLN